MVAPYCYKGDQWFSYDDEKSFEVKAKYILDHQLGGAMVWSIDTDDFQGFCGRKNGLLETLADVRFANCNPAETVMGSSPCISIVGEKVQSKKSGPFLMTITSYLTLLRCY